MSDLDFDYRIIEARQYPQEIFPSETERRRYAATSRAVVGAFGLVRDPASHESHLQTAIQQLPSEKICRTVFISVSSFDPSSGRGTMPNSDHSRGLAFAAHTYRFTFPDYPVEVMTFGNHHRQGLMLDELPLAAIGKSTLVQLGVPAQDIMMSTELRSLSDGGCYNTADELAIAAARLRIMNNPRLWIHVTREDRVARTLLHASSIGMVPHKIFAFKPENERLSFADQVTAIYCSLLDPSMQHPLSPMRLLSRLVKGVGFSRNHDGVPEGL